jgi:hypothetical protein
VAFCSEIVDARTQEERNAPSSIDPLLRRAQKRVAQQLCGGWAQRGVSLEASADEKPE